jgi:hypothetical protein
MIEKWLPVPKYDGKYEVSNLGSIRSLWTAEKIVLRAGKQSKGYLTVSLADGIRPKHSKSHLVHRLVATAFLGDPPEGKSQINHLDGNRENNCVTNLEWCDSKHNARHAVVALKSGIGQRNSRCKLTDQQIAEILVRLARGEKSTRFAHLYGVSDRYIRDVGKGKYRGQSHQDFIQTVRELDQLKGA